MSRTSGFSWPCRVYYEDTDASGVMYHARYLNFFERARTEWLRQYTPSQEKLRQSDAVAFTVANIEVDFLTPARLDDELAVSVGVAQARKASIRISQEMHRRGDGELLARARVRVGCVDVKTFRPRPLPGYLHPQTQPSGVSA